jgi:serine/threonine protein kinase
MENFIRAVHTARVARERHSRQQGKPPRRARVLLPTLTMPGWRHGENGKLIWVPQQFVVRKGTDVYYHATNKETGQKATVRKIELMDDEGHTGAMDTRTLREVSILKKLKHPNIVELVDVIRSGSHLYLCFTFCEWDLDRYIKKQNGVLSAGCIKSFAYQMLTALTWCHMHRILHRDLKPENMLVDLRDGSLKLCFFQLARTFELPLRTYTHEVVTARYRAPEILLGAKHYACAVDAWSIGTVIAEMAIGRPLFFGDSEIDQMFKIFRLLGTPSEKSWPGVSLLPDFSTAFPNWQPTPLREAVPCADRLDDMGLNLVQQLLTCDPQPRLTAREALKHPFFGDLHVASSSVL